MPRRPEPGSFEHLVTTVRLPCGGMVRLSRSPASEPYWSRRARYRFDDPSDPARGPRFGVLYLARDLPTAFCESVIHDDALFVGAAFQVPITELESRQLTRYTHPKRKSLLLIDLTDEALKKLGLNNDLSAGHDYTAAQQWSRALYAAKPRADGIRYASRQKNASHCYAIFERSGLVAAASRPLSDAEKVDLCRRFNVVPV